MLRKTKLTQEEFNEALEAIEPLERPELLERWQAAHGNPAPKGISRRLLEYSAAYQLQVKAFGGLSASTRKILTHYAKGSDGEAKVVIKSTKTIKLSPGTRLVREWHGHTYHVEVINKGFLYNSTTYDSLSAIAREITGARWSGPRFFGL